MEEQGRERGGIGGRWCPFHYCAGERAREREGDTRVHSREYGNFGNPRDFAVENPAGK